MLNAFFSTFLYFWASYGCLLVGLIYFVLVPRGVPLGRRLLVSLYAPVAAALFLAVTFTDQSLWSPKGVPLFLVLQLVPLALLVVSLRRFNGPRAAHFILVPLALVCWGWQLFWGYLGSFAG